MDKEESVIIKEGNVRKTGSLRIKEGGVRIKEGIVRIRKEVLG